MENQLKKEQVGTCGGYDKRQEKRDKRKMTEKSREVARVSKETINEAELNTRVHGEHSMDSDVNANYCVPSLEEEFSSPKIDSPAQPKIIDVMGPVSLTADRLGLSLRERTMMAASVANTLGVDIEKTNIGTYKYRGEYSFINLVIFPIHIE